MIVRSFHAKYTLSKMCNRRNIWPKRRRMHNGMEIETFEGTTTLSLSLSLSLWKETWNLVVQFSVRGELRLHGVRLYRKISLKRGMKISPLNETIPTKLSQFAKWSESLVESNGLSIFPPYISRLINKKEFRLLPFDEDKEKPAGPERRSHVCSS